MLDRRRKSTSEFQQYVVVNFKNPKPVGEYEENPTKLVKADPDSIRASWQSEIGRC